MTPDFDKIQAGMNNGLNKTSKISKEDEAIKTSSQSDVQNGLSFRGTEKSDMGTGAAGRSSVKMDNFNTDMLTFKGHYDFAQMTNNLIDALVEQGYSLDEATNAVYNELGHNK